MTIRKRASIFFFFFFFFLSKLLFVASHTDDRASSELIQAYCCFIWKINTWGLISPSWKTNKPVSASIHCRWIQLQCCVFLLGGVWAKLNHIFLWAVVANNGRQACRSKPSERTRITSVTKVLWILDDCCKNEIETRFTFVAVMWNTTVAPAFSLDSRWQQETAPLPCGFHQAAWNREELQRADVEWNA